MIRTLALLAAGLAAACAGGGGGEVDPGEPNGTPAEATPLALGAAFVARIADGGDADWYRLTIPAGGATVRVQTFDEGGVACDPAAGVVDTRIQVYDGALAPLLDCPPRSGPCDDGGPGWCEDALVAVPEGTAYVEVLGWAPYPFGYALKVTLR